MAQQGQFISAFHRTGGVDQEHEVQRRAVLNAWHFTLESDVNQLRVSVPRGFKDVDRRLERLAVWRGVGVGKIVYHFFYPHGVGGGELASGKRRADERIGGGVHVDGEGRDRFFGCDFQRVGGVVGEGFCVEFADARNVWFWCRYNLAQCHAFGHQVVRWCGAGQGQWRGGGRATDSGVRFFAAAGFGQHYSGGHFHHWFGQGRDVSVICGFINQCWRDGNRSSWIEHGRVWWRWLRQSGCRSEVQDIAPLRRADHEAAGNDCGGDREASAGCEGV